MTQPARIALHLSGFMISLAVTLFGPGFTPLYAAESTTPSAAVTQAASGTGAIAPQISAKEAPIPDQFGMSAEYGYTYNPHQNIGFLLARVFAIYDYGAVWRQDRPKALRFKVEGAAGSTVNPASDLIASLNMLALYYPGRLGDRSLRPYVEAGIGAIYTQFRVTGQGLHFNFNPLLGVGCELPQQDGKSLFAAIRLHHISNAGINHENRGVNSVVLQIGRFF